MLFYESIIHRVHFLQVLRRFLSNCFQEAHNHRVTSLSIPPIGVGGLGFDAQFVASVMRDEVFEFSRCNPQTCLGEVRFVVYHKDSACIQVSYKQLCSMITNHSNLLKQMKIA